MKTTKLGKDGPELSIVGLGGEGILRTYRRNGEACPVILEALRQGITYYDCARVYADSELYYGEVWKKDPPSRKSVFQTSKSASRDRDGAFADLSQSLQRLQTQYLDLWQIHDVRTEEDFKRISGPGGALEAFISAKESGKVKYIGVTGHHDPYILSKAVEQWPVDTVLMPVNPVEEVIGGFLTDTLPTARKRGVAVIGMKVLGAGHYIVPRLDLTAELLVRYALTYEISVAIVGCSSPQEVHALSEAASLAPLSASEKNNITEMFAPHARELAFYRGAL